MSSASCLPAKCILRFLFFALIAQCAIPFCDAAHEEQSSSDITQEKDGNPPVSENGSRFVPQETENGDSDTSVSNICFPYFISQDVEALLAQAIRMLDRSVDERQKGWLLIFVQKLDSLSRQLRSLPAEHRNMCFQSRRRILGKDGLDADIVDGMPDDMQLHYAKKLFDPRVGQLRMRKGPEQYVTGKVHEHRPPGGPLQRTHQNDKRFRFLSSYPQAMRRSHPEVSDDNSRQLLNSANVSALQKSSPDKHDVGGSADPKTRNPISSKARNMEPIPVAYWHSTVMTYENMPFLPRSTRKTIPRPLVNKLKYQPHDDGNKEVRPSSEESQQAIPTAHSPTTELQSRPSTPSHEVDVHNQRNSLEQHSKINPENHSTDHDSEHVHNPLVDSTDETRKTGEARGEDRVSSSNISQEDDLVSQLHSGIMAEQQSKTEGVNSSPKVPSALNHASASLDKQQGLAVVPLYRQIVGQDPELLHEDHSPYGMYVDYRLANRPHSYDNNLDFEYEEQGAAAGELYNDDDNSERHLALPPSTQDVSAEHDTKSKNSDDAVRQLHELKSSNLDDVITDVHQTSTAQTSQSSHVDGKI